ncbi:hypothetical protein KKE34_01050 [Patescibacteria group bacterium]|nr:hypothetical protein [Patescibacteria group bacterium]MBU1885178.1 hypothetical protein [Patescibacteria group bacterium]
MKTYLAQLIYKLKRPFHFFKTGLLKGFAGQIKYKFPAKELKIIAITGTDGKTTSATLLYHVLKKSGKKVGLISTVAAYIGAQKITTGLHVTSPDPFQLHKLLRRMANKKIEYVVLEITSHGAYQYRNWGIKPIIAGLTNIAHEHLDYHLILDEYIKAKILVLKKAKTIILNRDDSNYQKVASRLNTDKILTYSLKDRLAPVVAGAIKDRFVEEYNWLNARLVYAILKNLGIDNKKISESIKSFPEIPGRMQEIEIKKKFRVIVDFAHTPQGVEAALTALKKQLSREEGRLIAVYGTAGLRDHQKRPLMGKIGAKLADLVIFTAEDPRTEDVWSIIRQLKENLHDDLDKIMSIADRREAIEFALTKIAKKGDIVAILGKGHEQSMCYGKTEYPWSDEKVVKEILKK